MEKSGLICYPPCPSNFTGVGPVCWKGIHPSFIHSYLIILGLHGVGRGVGKPMICEKGYQYVAGLCYLPCPINQIPDGPGCLELCPEDRPHRCGLLCTVDAHSCTEQTLLLSVSGFGILYGLGVFGASLAAILGTAGAAAAVAGFGIAAGTLKIFIF